MKTFATNSKTILMIFAIVLQLVTIACSGQSHNGEKTKAKKTAPPDIRYKVDKEYDTKGNLIRYDSSYTYSYSGNTLNDSLFKYFNQEFNAPFTSGFFDRPFKSFYSDSLFFEPQYRINPFINEDEHLRKILEEMKKIKNYNERFLFYDKPQQKPGKEFERSQGTGV